jgi:excisionase family DNA binding protein
VDDEPVIVEDGVAALGLNQQTIRSYIEDGMLRAVRVGNRRLRIRAAPLDAFLAAVQAPDRIYGLAAFDEAWWSLCRVVKSTKRLGQEERADLAEALDTLEGAQTTSAAVVGAAQSDPSPA